VAHVHHSEALHQSNAFVSSWNMHTSVRYAMKPSVRRQMAARIMAHVSFLGMATIELAQRERVMRVTNGAHFLDRDFIDTGNGEVRDGRSS
jgi:hypothetical protein